MLIISKRIFGYSSYAERLLLCVSALAAVGAGIAFPAMTIVIGTVITVKED